MKITPHRPWQALPGGVAVLIVASLAGCGGDGPSGSSSSATPTPSAAAPAPAPAPASTVTAQFAAPFGLTASRTLDVFGWQTSAGTFGPATAIGMRWNATSSSYEVMLPGQQFGRLTGTSPYSILNPDGTAQPNTLRLSSTFATLGLGDGSSDTRYTGRAISAPVGANSVSDVFAFGLVTAPSGMPNSGTRTCAYSADDDGDGTLVIDFAAGSVTGKLTEFYGTAYTLPPSTIPFGTAGFSAIGPNGSIDGQFFGPAAQELVVRWTSSTNNATIKFPKLWIMRCT